MKTSNPSDLASAIQRALALKGYEITLRKLSPRTATGKRNQEERALELASELIQRGV